MQNIIRLFAKYGSHITFILLQVICFYIVVNFNSNHKSIYINSANLYANQVDGKLGQWQNYLSLRETNDSLSNYNAQLLELYINRNPNDPAVKDTNLLQYRIIPAKVSNNTYQLRNNHLTLDKGKVDGVKPNQGVVSQNGLVGVVRNVSKKYAHVVSILNVQTKISATVRPHGYPGTLTWKKSNPLFVTLDAIPKHAEIAQGDTVVTSGYSTMFPPNIDIGTIEEFTIDRGSSNYEIKVRLFNDVPNEKHVFIINNTLAEEQKKLESQENE